MQAAEFSDVLARSKLNDWKRYPDKTDSRVRHGMLFPHVEPRFTFDMPATVFTIGSCFARNIEEALAPFPVTVPTRSFAVPKEEWPFRPNGLLNEYNPGSIAQRLTDAALDRSAPPETIRAATGGGCVDMMLPGGPKVGLDRAIERRAEIDAIYRRLPTSDLLVITLGMIEAWHDNELGVYLNRMPIGDERKNRGRFSLHQMEADESTRLLTEALQTLSARAPKLKVVLTVSPVPLQTTFGTGDAVMANAVSKGTLRLVAQRIVDRMPGVDYFPSYEMVTSGGPAVFGPDNVHVRDEIVQLVTEHMISLYFPKK
jgi:hypothetical protein